ncbi:hypothetical protein FN846DRAFT_777125, partial [Sphaerosporella brunnea]
ISCMGDWYRNAQVCLVYLDDYPSPPGSQNQYSTRGWTLQEIVMSQRAVFYDREWQKSLDRLCRVPVDLLCSGGKLDVAASAILRMARKRTTFKPEDRAYSLMGIVGVRMAIDCGRGKEKAFSRLFESIIRTAADVSIFNWTGKNFGQ